MDIKQKLIETGNYLLAHQLAWGTSGNLSARVDDSHMIMSASGTFMGGFKETDIVKCNIHTGGWEGERKPSKEIPMHKGIYQQRQDAQVILHSSPFYVTLCACSEIEIYSELFIETMYYLENINYVDYLHPGSEDLGEVVKKKALDANIIMMRNHGVILFDKNFSDAIMRLETLEMACRLIVEAKMGGIKLNKISDRMVEDFRERGIYKPLSIDRK
ncbi:class II aldolase/adducin family protein [Peribacillus muralis]|uniref:class II aldolase/adducin family protein n=1 Tax=Peribacillus muralis TaxID=264697 RepID=UPI00070E439D|nr:class II aldolase/adducin family protein [Peribacillus muralis]